MISNNKALLRRHKVIFSILFCFIFCLSALPNPIVKAEEKASYKMQKEEVTYKDGDIVRGIVSFQYPKIEGNSDAVAKINEVLENAMKAYMADESAKSLKDYTLDSIKNDMFWDENEQYYLITKCKITYNTGNIISMHMKEMWYAGGVYNQMDYGFTFDLKTGKTLTAVDVIGGTSKQVISKVLSSAKKYFNIKSSRDETEEVISPIITSYNAKNFKFYLIPGKARICFGSYELNCGNSYQVLSVASKYK